MIVILIIAIMSATLVLNFQSASEKGQFDAQVTNIVRVIEQARNYSLSNYLVNDSEPTEYYLLTIGNDYLTLEAFAEFGGLHETLVDYDMDKGFTTTGSDDDELFYIPPYGELCLTYPCVEGGEMEYSFTISNADESLTQPITITTYGGFAEVE